MDDEALNTSFALYRRLMMALLLMSIGGRTHASKFFPHQCSLRGSASSSLAVSQDFGDSRAFGWQKVVERFG
jgi:hypothetical protein